MEKARAHMVVEGRVQGVFYRAFTRNVAARLGLNGWVRNLPDGRVEAVFEGSRGLVEQALTECRKGPFGSRVDDMDISWEPAAGEAAGFEIRY
jgi:acylphosphatase